MTSDPINHPSHYTNHPSGFEAITFSGKMNFALGNAFKYLYRCGHKGSAMEDLKKAEWYLRYELEQREKLWFKREPRSAKTAFELQIVLTFEGRYGSRMKSALLNVWGAHTQKRSTATIRRALEQIKAMILVEKLRPQ